MYRLTALFLGIHLAYPMMSQGAILPSQSSLTSILQGNLPISFDLATGELGLPDLNSYLSNFTQLSNQIPITTLFGGNGSATTLADLLASIDPTDSGLLLDIAVDGNVIYSEGGDNNYRETVVAPYNLQELYYRLGTAEVATQIGHELGLSSLAQSAINDVLNLSQISYSNSQTSADNSATVFTNSENRANLLSSYQQSISNLSSFSQGIANSSLVTDTSFQLLRNISQQLSVQAQQNQYQAAQDAEIGQLIANTSEQMREQSRQFQEQQSTATHLLETAKQQQVLQAIQATTNGQQLELLTQAATEQNRLDNAAFQHAQQGAGMILIPLAPPQGD